MREFSDLFFKPLLLGCNLILEFVGNKSSAALHGATSCLRVLLWLGRLHEVPVVRAPLHLESLSPFREAFMADVRLRVRHQITK
jgi:hypothetical protein